MKIVTIVGARPQFIKAAVVSKELRKYHQEKLVHTGQHFDTNMSDIFFNELDIPAPNYNLGISGGSHAEMTGKMMIEIEKVLLKENPDAVLLYGDTNSTLAASISAVKLHIPVIHVESGNRFGNLDSPEEVNRICTDHVSSLLFACTPSALDSLKKENLDEKSFLVGDPMFDAFLLAKDKCGQTLLKDFFDIYGNVVKLPNKKEYYYLTCHRQENSIEDNLYQILSAMNSLNYPTIYPVHPRNIDRIKKLNEKYNFKNIFFLQPVGYLESIALLTNSNKVVTDSGGVQREAFFAGIQCLTVLDFVVWPETMAGNRNQLVKPNKKDILDKLGASMTIDKGFMPFGDGNAAKHIVDLINKNEQIFQKN